MYKIKMLHNLFGLTFILAFALADPIATRTKTTDLDVSSTPLDVTEGNAGKRLTRQIHDIKYFALEMVRSWIGRYFDVQNLVICVMNWLVSNVTAIIIGALAVFGFCGITNKCSVQYENLIPVSQLTAYITPDSIDTVEEYFLAALEKYRK